MNTKTEMKILRGYIVAMIVILSAIFLASGILKAKSETAGLNEQNALPAVWLSENKKAMEYNFFGKKGIFVLPKI
jgi:hypothetical protein